MAMVRVAPVQVEVRADWFDGTPREIRWNDRTLPVVSVTAVRDETSAYPAVVGPRTVFEVATPGPRVALAFRHRTRRWSIEGVDQRGSP